MPLAGRTRTEIENLIGTATKELMAEAASGTKIDEGAIKAKLTGANQQMKSGG